MKSKIVSQIYTAFCIFIFVGLSFGIIWQRLAQDFYSTSCALLETQKLVHSIEDVRSLESKFTIPMTTVLITEESNSIIYETSIEPDFGIIQELIAKYKGSRNSLFYQDNTIYLVTQLNGNIIISISTVYKLASLVAAQNIVFILTALFLILFILIFANKINFIVSSNIQSDDLLFVLLFPMLYIAYLYNYFINILPKSGYFGNFVFSLGFFFIFAQFIAVLFFFRNNRFFRGFVLFFCLAELIVSLPNLFHDPNLYRMVRVIGSCLASVLVIGEIFAISKRNQFTK